LHSLIREAAEEVQAHKAAPPESCTRCGRPWSSGPNGELHCVFDGWVWDGKPLGGET
jgi:hypothetical protein